MQLINQKSINSPKDVPIEIAFGCALECAGGFGWNIIAMRRLSAFRSHTRARCDETEAVLREPNDRARGTRGRVVRRSSAWEQRPNEEREREAATERGNYYAERGTSESAPREAEGDSRAHISKLRSL